MADDPINHAPTPLEQAAKVIAELVAVLRPLACDYDPVRRTWVPHNASAFQALRDAEQALIVLGIPVVNNPTNDP